MSMSRRELLTLLLTSPLVGRARLQTPPSPGRRVISQGASTYLIEADGTVKAWSLQEVFRGYLGLGSADRVRLYTAFEVPSLRHAVKIAAGDNAGFALMPDGGVLAWGANARGELGITPRAELEVMARAKGDAYVPTPVINVPGVADIAAGDNHALAVTTQGSVFTWGYNLEGQLGLDPRPVINFKTHTPADMDYVPFPIQIPGLTNVKAVAAGAAYSLALLEDGTLRAWGKNRMGQLGDGTVVDRKTPVPVVGVRNAVAVAAKASLSAALLADGTVMTWGAGTRGLGRKLLERDTPYPIPALVEGVADVRAIALSSMHVLALTGSGAVLSWGDQNVGEVGRDGAVPGRVPGLSAVRWIEATTGQSLCVQTDGTIMVFGFVPWWARLDGGEPTVSHTPIPLVVKDLRNPW
jgi:alpha-tubulin suppressor-like RCC1 family protein